ncbi:DEAD/DEAH box helicase family protein [Candidatus Vampirococcus lugosii]|uniref:Type III restriction endonuclease subunit R n=1 Tax=Candidatus Vampirococcus lugosii TaxID=2789015 RepID=A0ABS5QLL1_9BACT|nr:DEAD/DEAH box helicase family protein [Candidatus Vampirococcus lugosii]MBS8122028.1 type III restriction endonuclease subunit R [Candidatus Vampirococcus lugosii]
MKQFIDKLKVKILDWKLNGYEGTYKETQNILKYINNNRYLREPQIDAFETYVYIKEILGNKPIGELIFDIIGDKKEIIKSLGLSQDEMLDLMMSPEKMDEKIKSILGENSNSDYSNQVYALTMGTGKTVLMTVFMLYEIVLSYYHSEDKRFAKNFVFFAPDKTIIESLKEIKSFDYNLVIPKEYSNSLLQIKYHYLEDTITKLTIPEGSNYNIIVSNSQKIIIKSKKASNDLQKQIFGDDKSKEKSEVENERFTALKNLDNLSIFIDEAHHSFGKTLDNEIKKLKFTINRIHENKPLVNCINMTGTPYVNGQLIEDVVFYYGLKNGIQDGILKQVEVIEYGEVKGEEFLLNVITEFWQSFGENKVEGKLAKIAIYTASIEELKEVRRTLETKVFKSLKIDTRKITENHTGASKQEIEEFKNLDTKESKKQFILLVGKGTEGWNCKSLFATALYRKPPQIFTLQATTRCLRAIGDNNKKAKIFLSKQNYKILDKELKKNFDIEISDLQGTKRESQEINCTIEKRKTIKIKKIIKDIKAIKKNTFDDFILSFNNYKGREIYRNVKELKLENNEAIYTEGKLEKNNTNINKDYSYYEILGIINKYTHINFNIIKKIFKNNKITKDELVKEISKDNYKLNFIIDELIKEFYNYDIEEKIVGEDMKIIKLDVNKFNFEVGVDKIDRGLVCYKEDKEENRLGFHLNPYNFDSTDEREIFAHIRKALKDNENVKEIYFTGGTDKTNYTDFYFAYEIFKDGQLYISNYFPDLLVEIENSNGKTKYIVLEIKGGDKKSDYLSAKQNYKNGEKITNEVFAKEIGFMKFKQINKDFEYRIVFDGNTPSEKLNTEKYIKNNLI